ncbi:MAG TPA: hypothetical protein PKY82_02550 [Pyrinomonadaceae bacterium]|nr:hypothetical protein [Pyrinomonadaceae bacterium]
MSIQIITGTPNVPTINPIQTAEFRTSNTIEAACEVCNDTVTAEKNTLLRQNWLIENFTTLCPIHHQKADEQCQDTINTIFHGGDSSPFLMS